METFNEVFLYKVLDKAWSYASKAVLDDLVPNLYKTMVRYQITDIVTGKHFLGQVGHECGQGRYREELASGAAYEGRLDLGNTQKGDGVKYKGRGLIQLTGRGNYTKYSTSELPVSRGLSQTIIDTPKIVATDTELCCDAAGWFWDVHHLSSIANGPKNQNDTCKDITRVINGGYTHLKERQTLVALVKSAWVYFS